MPSRQRLFPGRAELLRRSARGGAGAPDSGRLRRPAPPAIRTRCGSATTDLGARSARHRISGLSLQPTEPGAVRRVHELMMRHRWEVFFITQRPATDGDTVQRQTQRWLVEQGFDLPSVLVIARVARSGRRRASAGLPRRRQRPELPRRDGGRCRESRAHLGPIGSGRRRVQEAGRRDYADDRRVPGSAGEGLRRAEQPDAAEQACGARRVEVAKHRKGRALFEPALHAPGRTVTRDRPCPPPPNLTGGAPPHGPRLRRRSRGPLMTARACSSDGRTGCAMTGARPPASRDSLPVHADAEADDARRHDRLDRWFGVRSAFCVPRIAWIVLEFDHVEHVQRRDEPDVHRCLTGRSTWKSMFW